MDRMARNRCWNRVTLATRVTLAIAVLWMAMWEGFNIRAQSTIDGSVTTEKNRQTGSAPDQIPELDLWRRQLILRKHRLQERWTAIPETQRSNSELSAAWLTGITRGDEYLRRSEHLQLQIAEIQNDRDYFRQLASNRLLPPDEGMERYSSDPGQRTHQQTAEIREHVRQLQNARQAWQEQLENETRQPAPESNRSSKADLPAQGAALRQLILTLTNLPIIDSAVELVSGLTTWEQTCEDLWVYLDELLIENRQQRALAIQQAVPRQIEWLNECLLRWEELERGVEPKPEASAANSNGVAQVLTLPTDATLRPETTNQVGKSRAQQRTSQLQMDHLQVTSQIATLRNKLEVLQQKIQATGLNDSNTALLLDTRRHIPSRQTNQQLIRSLLEESRLETLEDLNQLERRDELRTQIAVVDSQGHEQDRQRIQQELSQAEADIVAQQKLLELLSLVATERESLDQALEAMEEYLNYQLLWVRDTNPLGMAQVKKAWEGGQRLGNPGEWFDLAASILRRAWHRPIESVLAVVGLAALACWPRWLNS